MGQVVSHRFPTVAVRFDSRSDRMGFVVDKMVRFSPSTSVSPDNSHSTICSIFISHLNIDAVQS
jgi:hypothetical protein